MSVHPPVEVRIADIASFWSLRSAALRAARGKRHQDAVQRFLCELEANVLRLEEEILSGTYAPSPYQSFRILEPKPRLISAAAFRDRVVHHALCAALEPLFERQASPNSFACRVLRGTRVAIRSLRHHVRRARYALKLDIHHFFETIDHEVLLRRLHRFVTDDAVRNLLTTFVRFGAPGSALGQGMPIGNLTSQYFANFYLTPLDRLIERHPGVIGYVRYMDDMVVLAHEKSVLWTVHARVEEFVEQRLRVALKPAATRVLPIEVGVPFLGFVIFRGVVRFDPVRLRRFRARIRRRLLTLRRDERDPKRAQAALCSLLGWAESGNTTSLRYHFAARLRRDGLAG